MFFLDILTQISKKRTYQIRRQIERIIIKGHEQDKEWADRLVKKIRPNVVIFDWRIPNQYTITPLIKSVKGNGILVVSLPHGLNVYTTDDKNCVGVIKEKSQELAKYCREKGIWFDHTVSQGPVSTMHLLAQGYNHSEIVELGSMRFSREWLKKYPDIFKKRSIVSNNAKKVRVVVFFSTIKYNANTEEIRKLIDILASKEYIHLILKPHSQGIELLFLKDIISRYQIKVASSVSSFELSSWCDMAIVWGSSIGLQTLHDKKILIEPIFADTNESVYEKYGAACVAKNVDQVIDFINTYKKNGKIECYSQEQVDALFRDIVYAGDLKRNVIKDYADFLDSIAS